ncbi:hypothetical protein FRB93_006003 [Tulasnella sp. JGI-2019a]|nr:hypothetical protein FRB93_006003 [Tulasnella sp. JGI-2019a]
MPALVERKEPVEPPSPYRVLAGHGGHRESPFPPGDLKQSLPSRITPKLAPPTEVRQKPTPEAVLLSQSLQDPKQQPHQSPPPMGNVQQLVKVTRRIKQDTFGGGVRVPSTVARKKLPLPPFKVRIGGQAQSPHSAPKPCVGSPSPPRCYQEPSISPTPIDRTQLSPPYFADERHLEPPSSYRVYPQEEQRRSLGAATNSMPVQVSSMSASDDRMWTVDTIPEPSMTIAGSIKRTSRSAKTDSISVPYHYPTKLLRAQVQSKNIQSVSRQSIQFTPSGSPDIVGQAALQPPPARHPAIQPMTRQSILQPRTQWSTQLSITESTNQQSTWSIFQPSSQRNHSSMTTQPTANGQSNHSSVLQPGDPARHSQRTLGTLVDEEEDE